MDIAADTKVVEEVAVEVNKDLILAMKIAATAAEEVAEVSLN